MKKITIAFTMLIALTIAAGAQNATPIVKGTVNISITKGTFDCDIILDSIPRIKDYYIRLNSGMNILFFKNVAANSLIYYEKTLDDTLATGEANAYYFSDNTGKGKFLPRSLEIRYTGMFPVAKDTINNYSVEDWKGNIAFNGYSVRTDGMQTCWYPVLYDITNDTRLNKVMYDLQVNCEDCNEIYLNGNAPVKGRHASLKSSFPVDISMYMGRYKTANVDGTYFLNPDIGESQIKAFGAFTNDVKKLYEEHLGIAYRSNVTYIQTTPTSKNNAWLFVSYPSIFNIGWGDYGLKSMVDDKKGASTKPYIAHELGHYYFATVRTFNSELGDMINEGFSEYLSLQAARQLISDSIYKSKVSEKVNAMKKFKAVPIGQVKSAGNYKNRQLYVYTYAPLVFTAIEKEIGQEQMWKWMQQLLTMPAVHTNYAFFKAALSAAIGDDAKANTLAAKYFEADNAQDNVLAKVGE